MVVTEETLASVDCKAGVVVDVVFTENVNGWLTVVVVTGLDSVTALPDDILF